jgi:hypothetical protein
MTSLIEQASLPPNTPTRGIAPKFDALRIVTGLVAGQSDPTTFELYAIAHSAFRDQLYDGTTGRKLADEDFKRCLKIFATLDRDNSPQLTDDTAKTLIPLLGWLHQAGDTSLVGAPKLAHAAKVLLETLNTRTVPNQPSRVEAAIARGLRQTTRPAGAEITRRGVTALPRFSVPNNDNSTTMKLVKTYVPENIMLGLKAVAVLQGTTTEHLLRDLVTAVVTQYQKPAPLDGVVVRTVKNYQSRFRKGIPDNSCN